MGVIEYPLVAVQINVRLDYSPWHQIKTNLQSVDRSPLLVFSVLSEQASEGSGEQRLSGERRLSASLAGAGTASSGGTAAGEASKRGCRCKVKLG